MQKHHGAKGTAPTSRTMDAPSWCRLPNRFRLDKILVGKLEPATGRWKAGFETVAEAEAEDRKRLRSIQREIDQAEDLTAQRQPIAGMAPIPLNPEKAGALCAALEAGITGANPRQRWHLNFTYETCASPSSVLCSRPPSTSRTKISPS
jgi:hypothetical protein